MDIRRFISRKRPHEATPSEDDIDKGTSEELSKVTNESTSPSSPQSPGDVTRHDLLPTPPHSKSSSCHLMSRESNIKLSFLIKESGKRGIPG